MRLLYSPNIMENDSYPKASDEVYIGSGGFRCAHGLVALHIRGYARNRLKLTSHASQSHLVVVGWQELGRPRSTDGCIYGILGTG